MSDKFRELLEQQLAESDGALAEATKNLHKYLDLVDSLFADCTAYRQALERHTKNLVNPYHFEPLKNPIDAILAKRQGQEINQEGSPNSQENGEKRLGRPPSPYSKKGVTLAILQNANGKGLRLNEVFLSQSPDAPLKLTKEDLYRTLPRLVSEDKAWRDNAGHYHYGSRPKNVEKGEGSNYLPLAG